MPRSAIQAADDAVSELRAALADVGVCLPSLGADPVGIAGDSGTVPLVELGRCTADTARALADVLRKVPGAAE